MTSEQKKSKGDGVSGSNCCIIESLTDPIECDSIVASIPDFSLFKVPKKGFIRLVKDNRKRRYALELFNHDSSKVFLQDKSLPLKPLHSFEVISDYHLSFNLSLSP